MLRLALVPLVVVAASLAALLAWRGTNGQPAVWRIVASAMAFAVAAALVDFVPTLIFEAYYVFTGDRLD